jgi:3-carboxy-cis,cis-muconate cycloisomerase
MLLATASALSRADDCLVGLEPQPGRMQANFDAALGLPLAETASFALADHMPRPDAQALVKEACQEALAARRDLLEVLAARTNLPLDWSALRDPARWQGSSSRFIESALVAWRTLDSRS